MLRRATKELAKELLDYEIHIDEDANDKYGAFKVGTHDDLVTALGLATLIDPPDPNRVARGTSTGGGGPIAPRFPMRGL
jgi:hypothetical protein